MRKVWNAITKPEKLSQWFDNESVWEMDEFEEGKTATVTLFPNEKNELEEKTAVTVTIEHILPFIEFHFVDENKEEFAAFRLKEEKGIRVFLKSEGFSDSLEKLKALVEKK